MPQITRRSALVAGLVGAVANTVSYSALAAENKPSAEELQARKTITLADGWRFHLGHASNMEADFSFGLNQRTFAKPGRDTSPAAMAIFDDSSWQSVQVPHDWAVELPYAPPLVSPEEDDFAPAAHGFKAIGRQWPQNSIGWYRRVLPIDIQDKGRAVWLEFDGVFRDCIVFVNGYIVGGSESGYAPFKVDIGKFLDFEGGPNVVAVRVDASLGEGWFYEGAGIYRNVQLVSAASCHIPQWGIYVRPETLGVGARVNVQTTVNNFEPELIKLTLRHRIIGTDDEQRGAKQDLEVAAGSSQNSEALLLFDQPKLWQPASPYLYRLITEILRDGIVIDRVETPFGIRTVAFDSTTGFSINGQPMKLLGVCNHQDHAGVGSAIPDALHSWRVARSKEMGVNAWRSAHNPPSQALLDVCDREGVMMIAETRQNSTSKIALDELDRMLLSSRNHPSIILWSVGNEEPHQATERGRSISAKLVSRCKALDPTRLTTQGMDAGWDTGAAQAIDVVGFNYRIDKIAAWHERNPNKPVIGSETGSTVATRGAYANDRGKKILQAYDTEFPWWASTAESWWNIISDSDYIAGGFIWTGFDYRGEPTPFTDFPAVSSYFGVMDLCGFPKDNYYYYRAWWRPDQPLVHLLPHWNWQGREGQPINVWVHANCREVELRLNGKSLGKKAMPRNGHLEWKVPFASGKLEAIGFDGSRAVARDERVTAGQASRLRLGADRTRLRADGADLAMIRVDVTDRAGIIHPTADNELNFSVTGPARIIGLGNGNPTSTDPDKGTKRRAFNGLAQGIVQGTGEPGLARVTVKSSGLVSGMINLNFHDLA